MKIRGFCWIFIARGKPWEKASTTPTANANRRDAFIAERIYEIDANLTILDKTVWWADASIYVNIYGAKSTVNTHQSFHPLGTWHCRIAVNMISPASSAPERRYVWPGTVEGSQGRLAIDPSRDGLGNLRSDSDNWRGIPRKWWILSD